MLRITGPVFLGLATFLCTVDAGRIHYIAQSPKGSARLEGEAAVTGAPAPSTPSVSNLVLQGTPWWAGKSVADARKALAEKQKSGEKLAGTGVTDTEDLDLLSDDELYEVFSAGVPDVPGRLPGEESMPASFVCRRGRNFLAPPVAYALQNGLEPPVTRTCLHTSVPLTNFVTLLHVPQDASGKTRDFHEKFIHLLHWFGPGQMASYIAACAIIDSILKTILCGVCT